MNKRPNIIIFNPDQMRADTLAHLGNPASVTPNLDAFAKNDAVSFSNTFCQNPVCVPSRCSFLTGLYPHVNGHRTMNYMLRDDEHSMLQELKQAGYYVWMNDRNDYLPAQVEGIFEKDSNEIYLDSMMGKGRGAFEFETPNDPSQPGFYSFYCGKIVPENTAEYKSGDDGTVEAALEFLRRRPEDQPFCMFMGLVFPHPDYMVEEPYFSAIDNSKLPKRIPTPEEIEKMPRMLQEMIKKFNLGHFIEDDWDKIRACYLGMCMKVDAQFGLICDTLRKAGIYDDTDIYVFSDHGDFTGDYGLPEKAQNLFPDCLTNVPLLIKPHKGVEIDPGVSDSLVELVDFYATAMDLAGVEPTHMHYGKSLRAVLKDRSLSNREYVFCEGGRLKNERYVTEGKGEEPSMGNHYYPRSSVESLDDIAHGKATMIRSHQYKYVSRIYEKDEFYDLIIDPSESSSRIDDPAYKNQIVMMKSKMLEWYQSTCDIVPFEQDDRFTPAFKQRMMSRMTKQ